MGVTFHEDTKFKDELEEEENAKLKEPTFVDKLKQQRLEGKYFLTTKSHAISTTVFFGLLFIGISLLLKSANQQGT
uniref:Transmembrane protein n=1 Tax=Caenorhabditis japonica TaxID=281687 RepID=A0A8R1IS79_CAEJA